MIKDGAPAASPHLGLDALYGLLNVVILAPVAVSFTSIIFSHPMFTPLLPSLTKLVLFSCAVHQLCFSCFSSLPFAIGQVQDAGLIFLSAMAFSIVESMHSQGRRDEDIVTTVLVVLSISTFVLGVALICIGRLRFAVIVQYIPVPVIGGYLAFIGFFCGNAGIVLMTGLHSSGLTFAKELLEPHLLVRWLPGVALGVGMYMSLRTFRSPYTLPLYMCAMLVAFFGFLYLKGWSLEDARHLHLIAPLTRSQSEPFYQSWEVYYKGSVEWTQLPKQFFRWLAMFVVVAFSSSLDVAAIEMELNSPLDYNKELMTVGISNLVSGMFGGFTGSYIFSQTIFTLRRKVESRICGLVVVACELLIITLPFAITSYIPRLFFGAFLTLIATDLMFEWLLASRRKLMRSEFAVCWLTFLCMQFLGVEAGLVLGILFSTVGFVLSYAETTAVEPNFKCSTVVRTFRERSLLMEQRGRLVTLSLHGHIFFGSAMQILEDVKGHVFSGSGATAVSEQGAAAVGRARSQPSLTFFGWPAQDLRLCGGGSAEADAASVEMTSGQPRQAAWQVESSNSSNNRYGDEDAFGDADADAETGQLMQASRSRTRSTSLFSYSPSKMTHTPLAKSFSFAQATTPATSPSLALGPAQTLIQTQTQASGDLRRESARYGSLDQTEPASRRPASSQSPGNAPSQPSQQQPQRSDGRLKDLTTEFLVLDFLKVFGIDATATRSCFLMLSQLMRQAGVSVVFTNMRAHVESTLRANDVIAATDVVIPLLDDALEWCEEQILSKYDVNSAPPAAHAATPMGPATPPSSAGASASASANVSPARSVASTSDSQSPGRLRRIELRDPSYYANAKSRRTGLGLGLPSLSADRLQDLAALTFSNEGSSANAGGMSALVRTSGSAAQVAAPARSDAQMARDMLLEQAAGLRQILEDYVGGGECSQSQTHEKEQEQDQSSEASRSPLGSDLLCRYFDRSVVEEGTLVFDLRQGADLVYFLQEGEVELVRVATLEGEAGGRSPYRLYASDEDADADTQLLQTTEIVERVNKIHSGGIFGEAAFVLNSLHSVRAISLRRCVLWTLSRSSFRRMEAEQTTLCLTVQQILLKSLSINSQNVQAE
jgi:MFS superfamily sulfate permease-like transporter/CRP-like cAMP-binding protein